MWKRVTKRKTEVCHNMVQMCINVAVDKHFDHLELMYFVDFICYI
jgi:hypothetical protein